ncbi:MAG: hypothetical protein IKH57_19000 [Clostridia bacterium]|nr:hypothetical protein [Clostridia bacterium]
MKKEYTAPKAEKVEFDYQNTVAASQGTGDDGDDVMTGKNNANACYTHNGSNVNNGCQGKPK